MVLSASSLVACLDLCVEKTIIIADNVLYKKDVL